VAVVGGESVQTRGMGMTGAVDLAALAALHAGAGRVMVSYLNQGDDVATRSMEVMSRSFDALDLKNSAVVCGCGGGIEIKKCCPKFCKKVPNLFWMPMPSMPLRKIRGLKIWCVSAQPKIRPP
jgi:NAD(P)H-hydrate repair Nnr-like enzyme with NAD(P)H-hydrate dehydratase domain